MRPGMITFCGFLVLGAMLSVAIPVVLGLLVIYAVMLLLALIV